MYPGTIVHWHDESAIGTTTPAVVDNSPLFLTASSFDKGPEDLRVVRGQQFYDLYGTNIDFFKHGQPAIQAANIINAGGRLLVKRLVSYDAKLANKIFIATFNQILTLTPDLTDTDPDSKLPADIATEYDITDPNFDTTSTTKYVVSEEHTLSWSTSSVTNVKTFAEVKTQAATLEADNPIEQKDVDTTTGVITLVGSKVVPVFVVTDNGRGVSKKALRIVPDYNTSKDMTNFFYTLAVYEDTIRDESVSVSFNPDTTVGDTNYAITVDTTEQVRIELMDEVYNKFKKIYNEISGVDENTLDSYDLLFARTNRNGVIDGIELDSESIDLRSNYGIMVENGDNGSFGDAPFGTQEYIDAARWFFYPDIDGSSDSTLTDLLDIQSKYNVEGESDKIFDLDEYKICAVFDANYPDIVKESIAKLVTFREDCMYFRDYGLDISSYASIMAKQKSFSAASRNKFVADYLTTYQIYDPLSQKRIRVTMMYDFARQMIYHFISGPQRPLAGIVNNMILGAAIEGTINFTPRITPSVNQKAELDDARINYAVFQSGNCVVQSLYTAQEAYTQLTYINNVLAVQDVVRAVRTACPKYRYTFITGSDFSEYAEAVERVLSNYISNFAELGFDYQQDNLKAAQKIFYATITFRFNNWDQTEEFDIYALPDTDM